MAKATTATLPTARRRGRPWFGANERWALFFIWPALVGLLLFDLGPIIGGFVLSLYRWDLLSPPVFVGTGNYRALLEVTSPWPFTLTLTNTLWFAATVPLGVAVSLGLAMLVNMPLRGITIFRTIYYLPVITAVAAVALVWRSIYDANFGLANSLLNMVGIDGPRWLASQDWIKPSILIMNIWKGAGWGMMIFLASLQGVPDSYYEAAQIDGAGRWERFRHVTLPMISPTIFFVLVVSIINALQTFEQILIMAPTGGPRGAAATVVLYIYRNAFQNGLYGLGSAAAYVLFSIIVCFTLVQFWLQRKWVNYDI